MSSNDQGVMKITKAIINDVINNDSYIWRSPYCELNGRGTNQRMLAVAFGTGINKKSPCGIKKSIGHSGWITNANKNLHTFFLSIEEADKEVLSNRFASTKNERVSKKNRIVLPWSGKTSLGGKKFTDCAEAHVWLDLYFRNLNPKHYYCVAFNGDGRIAPPCNNCKQWVSYAFKGVIAPDSEYNSNHKYKP